MSEFSAILKKGGTFTMQGQYRKRSFWQWITRQPKSLLLFRVTEEVGSKTGGNEPFVATIQIQGQEPKAGVL